MHKGLQRGRKREIEMKIEDLSYSEQKEILENLEVMTIDIGLDKLNASVVLQLGDAQVGVKIPSVVSDRFIEKPKNIVDTRRFIHGLQMVDEAVAVAAEVAIASGDAQAYLTYTAEVYTREKYINNYEVYYIAEEEK